MVKVVPWVNGSGNITLSYNGQGDGTIVISSDTNNLDVKRSQTVEVIAHDKTQVLKINQLPNIPLPYDTEIEYLQSTGTQWINTLIPSTLTTKLVVRCSFTNTNSGRYGCVRYVTDTYRYYFGVSNSKWIAAVNSLSYDHNIGDADTLVHIFTLDNDGFYIDGLKKVNAGNEAINANILLCNVNNSQVNVAASSKLYYAKIYDDNVLVFDAIPVRVDNTGYMYDKISKQLFGNAGTGRFILGPDNN